MDKVSVGCIVYLIVVFERLQNHLKIYVNKIENVTDPTSSQDAATKAYVLAFTQALANEMIAADSGVKITALCPGYTATKMMDNPDQGATLRIPSSMMMSARDVAEIGIKACLAGKDIVVPGLANKLTTIITRLFSKSLITKVFGSFYRKNMD